MSEDEGLVKPVRGAVKQDVAFSDFAAIDMRVGTIVDVQIADTRKPTYRITVDFGPELGRRVSCAGARHYDREELVGRQVVAAVNLGEKRMGPEVSQFLVLGVPGADGDTVLLAPDRPVPDGGAIF